MYSDFYKSYYFLYINSFYVYSNLCGSSTDSIIPSFPYVDTEA